MDIEQDKLISGGRVVDPSNNIDGQFDILIRNGKIEAVDKPGAFKGVNDVQQVSAKNLLITPGLVDIHVHLREPGQEWKEDIASGSKSAVAGGFTTICCMPNTNPINDHAQITEFILKQAAKAGLCKVLPIGAISVKSESKALAPMMELREAGCVAFSDDGSPVADAGLMRRALEYSLMLDAVLTVHEEEKALSKNFAMNESPVSLKLGLKGMPEAAENVMISRDIELARLTGARVHFCHVSTARGALLIKRAKEDGIFVTAETAPHYIDLNESAIGEYDTNAKMSMPLRSQKDVEALLVALESGVIDCVASDHAPHDEDSKKREFQDAAFGILGFPTTLAIILGKVKDGKLSLRRAVESLTSAPAKCLGLDCGSLSKGAAADIAIIDTESKYILSPERIYSKSKNSPYLNKELQGEVVMTFMNGRQVFARA